MEIWIYWSESKFYWSWTGGNDNLNLLVWIKVLLVLGQRKWQFEFTGLNQSFTGLGPKEMTIWIYWSESKFYWSWAEGNDNLNLLVWIKVLLVLGRRKWQFEFTGLNQSFTGLGPEEVTIWIYWSKSKFYWSWAGGSDNLNLLVQIKVLLVLGWRTRAHYEDCRVLFSSYMWKNKNIIYTSSSQHYITRLK
jgi:hypothetical protein